MNVHFSDTYRNSIYQSPFAKEGQKQDREHMQTINGMQMLREQDGKQSHAMKSLIKQIEQLKKSITKVKGNEKMSLQDKNKEIQELQKQIEELQKQMTQLEDKEKQEKIKKAEEKRIEHLSEEEKAQEAQKLAQKALVNVATADVRVKTAAPYYFKANQYTKLAQMGMGSKYGGNLSVSEVSGLFRKAESYEKTMMKELATANKLVKSAEKAVEEYQKHKRDQALSAPEDKIDQMENKERRVIEKE